MYMCMLRTENAVCVHVHVDTWEGNYMWMLGGGPARSGVESAVRGCGPWVAGVGGLGPLPGGGAWGSPGHSRPGPTCSPSPDGTADKSPSRHVDLTLYCTKLTLST